MQPAYLSPGRNGKPSELQTAGYDKNNATSS